MPHTRGRYLNANFKKLAGLSPLIGILGHRQVGKTTFLENHCDSYFVLDTGPELNAVTDAPGRYLKDRAGGLVALDECQFAESLFPALKEWVRTHKKPGQFVLSGSVRFTSREAIKESLTGRIMNLELLPFNISELEGLPLSALVSEIKETKDLESLIRQRPVDKRRFQLIRKRLDGFLKTGGLPGICFIRQPDLRERKIEDQLRTMLDRDLRLVRKFSLPFPDLRRLVEILAGLQGTPMDYTELKRRSGLSTPTIKKILFALESVFLIRTVLIEGSTKGHVCFFEDVAEARLLSQREFSTFEDLTSLCFANSRHEFNYRLGEPVRMFQYRTRGGAYVPLCFAGKSGIVGILPIEEAEAWTRVSGTIESFLKTYANGKLILVHPGDGPRVCLNPRTLISPIAAIL